MAVVLVNQCMSDPGNWLVAMELNCGMRDAATRVRARSSLQ